MLKYLGIDPGLRKSLGFAIVEVPIRTDLASVDSIRIIEAALIDLRRIPLRVAASKLLNTSRKHRVSEALIEDFFFFGDPDQENGNGKRDRATWFVVARMQRTIGYLAGFLSSGGIPVDVVAPKRWKTNVEKKELDELMKRNGLKSGHVVSATALVLGELRARRKDLF